MLSYLQKFNSLPKDIKNAVASPEAAARIIEIGKNYGVDLPSTIMRVMAKEIALDGLGAYIVNQFNLPIDKAQALEKELRKYIFSPVLDYLLGSSAAPKLVFSEEDEREVKNIAPQPSADFDSVIEAAVMSVTTKTHIDVSDPLTSGKFKQVIKTYLRGTRDKKATLEALTKASELGGVALSRDAADRAIGAADLELVNLKKVSLPPRQKISVPEDMHQTITDTSPFKKIVRDADYDLVKALEQKNIPVVKEAPALDVEHELAPPVPAVVVQTSKDVITPTETPPAARTIIKEAVSGKPLDKKALRKVAAENPAPILNYKTSPSGKIRMDDVRFTPQVLGPIDELRYMTVKSFRRLNPDPIRATDRIKEKLELLGKEDYGKKIEGIVAWQDSPLNKTYLTLCRKALEVGKPIIDILKSELQHDPLSLKPEELSAIISLNRALKF